MIAEYSRDLAKVRLDRALELLSEAEDRLEDGNYKSANNRAFYSAEKSIKAALAVIGKDSETHNGMILMFNEEFIRHSSDFFDHDDLINIRRMERIRCASDYDDFYIASKADCMHQVEYARKLFNKVSDFLRSEGVL
ncbi:MAG: HEPN domain-containing protein [Eubacterium sp.]|nr:HEPN domain-containing protein [Eubacterium sp.]